MRVHIRSAAGGRIRLSVPWLRHDPRHGAAVNLGLAEVDGVRAVRAFPRTGSVVVWIDPRRGALRALVDALDSAPARSTGLVTAQPPMSPHRTGRLVLGSAVLGGAAILRAGFGAVLVGSVASGVFGLVGAVVGSPFLRRAAGGMFRRRAVGTDALITVATAISLVLRQNIVAVAVLTVLNLGELVQELLLRNSRRHVAQRLPERADMAWVVRGDVEVEVAASQLEPGDIVAVVAGDLVPVDGTVVDGCAVIDQSPVTTQLFPVLTSLGDRVLAGTRVRSGSILVHATAVGAQTVVAKLRTEARRVRAQHDAVSTEAGRFARRVVPLAFAAAGLTFVLTGDARRAMSTLLIACPCAVGLSTPTAVAGGVTAAARRGIHTTSDHALETVAWASVFVVGSGALAGSAPAQTALAFRRLRGIGIERIVVLTDSDHAAPLESAVGLAEVVDGATPEGRAEVVRALRAQGHVVAMVGSSAADLLALAHADVGLVQGATLDADSAALADLAIRDTGLTQLAATVELGRRTLGVMRQNYRFSVGINLVGLLAGAAGTVNPVLAALLHNGGGLAVIVNSLRLGRATPRLPAPPACAPPERARAGRSGVQRPAAQLERSPERAQTVSTVRK